MIEIAGQWKQMYATTGGRERRGYKQQRRCENDVEVEIEDALEKAPPAALFFLRFILRTGSTWL